jgi:hypothetical protein
MKAAADPIIFHSGFGGVVFFASVIVACPRDFAAILTLWRGVFGC